jgi:hypothetical protein
MLRPAQTAGLDGTRDRLRLPNGDEDRAMADGHFPDVELLRRELAVLILEWAGKAVKDDPDGAMSTALTRAVSEAARGAVAEQHRILTAEAADRIADALERRGKTGGFRVGSPWGLGLIAVAAIALLAAAFLLGMRTGRTEGALAAAPPSAASVAAPIAPLVPEPDAPAQASPRSTAERPPPAERTIPARAKPASRTPPPALGRPATASGDASARSTQPVGAATTTPAAPTPATPQ